MFHLPISDVCLSFPEVFASVFFHIFTESDLFSTWKSTTNHRTWESWAFCNLQEDNSKSWSEKKSQTNKNGPRRSRVSSFSKHQNMNNCCRDTKVPLGYQYNWLENGKVTFQPSSFHSTQHITCRPSTSKNSCISHIAVSYLWNPAIPYTPEN